MSETFELDDVYVEIETDAAIAVWIDEDIVWIPKSQIDDDSEVYKQGDRGTLIVSKWLARKKGWI